MAFNENWWHQRTILLGVIPRPKGYIKKPLVLYTPLYKPLRTHILEEHLDLNAKLVSNVWYILLILDGTSEKGLGAHVKSKFN